MPVAAKKRSDYSGIIYHTKTYTEKVLKEEWYSEAN